MTKLILTDELSASFDQLKEQSEHAIWNKDFTRGTKLLEQCWNLLPDPKIAYSESYHAAHALAEAYLQMGDLENAGRWSEILFDCALHRIDSGEKDFLAGKIAFEKKELESAKEHFNIANEKSDSRCFEGEDEKYWLFLLKK